MKNGVQSLDPNRESPKLEELRIELVADVAVNTLNLYITWAYLSSLTGMVFTRPGSESGAFGKTVGAG